MFDKILNLFRGNTTQLSLENITVEIGWKRSDVELVIDGNSILLSNQNIQYVTDLVRDNFYIVFNHYLQLANASEEEFNRKDLAQVCLSITVSHLHMYNMWRDIYKYEKNRSLQFDEKDFDATNMHDEIFHYCKLKYPGDWQRKAAVLVNMPGEQMREYYKQRELFYNK